jgi:hypothetical protein
MSEYSFKDTWEQSFRNDNIDLEMQKFSFYNFTRNPFSFPKLLENKDLLSNFPENDLSDFNINNFIFKKEKENEVLELKKEEDKIEENVILNANIVEERIENVNSQKDDFFREPSQENLSQIEEKIIEENPGNQHPENNDKYNEDKINFKIKENIEYSKNNSNSNFNSFTNNKIFKFTIKMGGPSEDYNNYNDFNNFENFENFGNLGNQVNNHEYEDFNNIEDMHHNFQNNNDENENPNSNICPAVLQSNSSAGGSVTNLSNRFQVFALKNKHTTNAFSLKENTSNNIITGKKIKNPINLVKSLKVNSQQALSCSNKKVITKEFFSQQINSLGNIHNQSVKNADLVNLENKFGMTSENLECPNYESQSEENLREEMKKYGMKPGSSKFMVKQLKEIWNFLNLSRRNLIF